MTAKHTPGPWTAHAMQPWVVDAEQTIVARVSQRERAYPDTECEANARLIAAAPDLLAALKAVNRQYGHGDDPCPCFGCTEVAEMVDAAIEKAEGKGE